MSINTKSYKDMKKFYTYIYDNGLLPDYSSKDDKSS